MLEVGDVMEAAARPDHVIAALGELHEVEIGADETHPPRRPRRHPTEPSAHLANHARAELVDIEPRAAVVLEPEPFVAAFVATEHGGSAERPARDQVLDPRAGGI